MFYLARQEFPGTGDTIIFFAYEDIFKKSTYFAQLDKLTEGALSFKVVSHDFTAKAGESLVWESARGEWKRIIIFGVGKENDLKLPDFRERLADAVKLASSLKSESVSFYYPHAIGTDYFEAGKHIALGFSLAQYRFDKYKGDNGKKKHEVKDLHVLFEKEPHKAINEGLAYGETIAQSVVLARNLVNEPASHLHPETLVEQAFVVEKESKGTVKVQVLDRDECGRLGMGSFLGVAQGSDREPKFIVLEYIPYIKKPTSAKATLEKTKKICLIGKSITFDSGGISIKPSGGMEEMKSDMAGGASVLGVFRVLARVGGVNHRVWGILPACENMPSGKAMRPGDVVTALNGKTAEVINTDAEGRLALADAVAYAEKYLQPDEIIDLATLTGACKVALGDDIAGLFGNNEQFNKRFLDAAKEEGEQVWELPLYKPYLSSLKSSVADIKNISGKGYGGAITGALFIGEFIKNTKWIHVDIAGPSYMNGNPGGTLTVGGTGWGILSIINLLRRA